MQILFAYFGMVLLWATTPLAIKWSVDGLGVLPSLTARMSVGLFCLLALLLFFKKGLPFTRIACLAYLAVAVQMYGAMAAVYWAAQFIPSGWISVISGLAPLMTAILAAVWLKERSLTIGKIASYIMGMVGLLVMFSSAGKLNATAVFGILGVLGSLALQAVSAIGIKRVRSQLPVLTQVTGGLVFSMPLYYLTSGLTQTTMPLQFSLVSFLSMLYLGIIATPMGFFLYYFLLSKRSATQVALVSLASPVLALWLGHAANHEPMTLQIIIGTTLILLALVSHNR